MRVLLFITFLVITNSFGQISNLTSVFNLPNTLDETSGLIYFKGNLISHNDSGDEANLYEIDINTGQITRTIHITNATNEDWEDITQDENYIYIGDFGNNKGNRRDLKIYRISKTDVTASNYVTAQIINFSYEDQTNFSKNKNTNFDAESLVVYNKQLLIFTKNRGNHKTKAYIFPKTIGTHTATRIGTYNVNGLITGATFNTTDNSFFLTGYKHNSGLHPFLIYLGDFTGNTIFNGTIVKTDITPLIGVDSQIEGITNLGNEQYYISCEEKNGVSQQLFSFESMCVLDAKNVLQKN